METDSELLELSAKAAGIEVWFPRMNGGKDLDGNRVIITPCHTMTPNGADEWNPLTDDGDALRLAINLGLQVSAGTKTNRFVVVLGNECGQILEERRPCEYAATRRAIVRAAAEIGRAKQNEASNGG